MNKRHGNISHCFQEYAERLIRRTLPPHQADNRPAHKSHQAETVRTCPLAVTDVKPSPVARNGQLSGLRRKSHRNQRQQKGFRQVKKASITIPKGGGQQVPDVKTRDNPYTTIKWPPLRPRCFQANGRIHIRGSIHYIDQTTFGSAKVTVKAKIKPENDKGLSPLREFRSAILPTGKTTDLDLPA